MAKKVYWSAFVDRAYGEAYRPHSSSDLGKLVGQMIALHNEMRLKDDVIVISKSRIYGNKGFQSFWNSKAGTKELMGYISMENGPQFYSGAGQRKSLIVDGIKIVR